MADEGKQKYTSAEIQKWLFEKAAQARDPNTARKIVASNDMRGRSLVVTGRLYFFKYNPKGRYTLPRYDKFPMCVPIEKYTDGFLGLNLHYLNVFQRQALLEMLLETRSEENITDKTVMRVNYDKILTNAKMERLSLPCIHRYLYVQVRSRFIEVYPSEFQIATQLPIEDWVFNT